MLLSAIVICSSAFLSRQVKTETETVDIAPVEDFAEAVQLELNRLENRYELRLREVFRSIRGVEEFRIREATKEIHGLINVSVLYPEGSIGDDRVVAGSEIKPEMTLRAYEKSKHLLEGDFFHSDGPVSGWEEGKEEGQYYFWEKVGKTRLHVATVSRDDLIEQIDTWLPTTKRLPTELVAGYAGNLRIVRKGKAILQTGLVSEPVKDVAFSAVIPARNRFATWTVFAQNPVKERVQWRLPILLGGAILGLGVALATWQVSSAYRRATHLAEQRVSFVNQASHELRTPITNILIHSDLAADSLEDDTGRAGEKIDLIREEAGRLGRLVDNVLTFSRHERGRFNFSYSSIVPDEVLQQCMDTFRPSFRRTEIAMHFDGGASEPFRTDSDALSQIVTNLLSNVEKYAAIGKEMKLRSRIDESGNLKIRVSDQGPGIPPGSASKVFRSFRRLSSEVSEGVSGTGLGLSIARELARGMGGDLQLLASETGATFELTLPDSSV